MNSNKHRVLSKKPQSNKAVEASINASKTNTAASVHHSIHGGSEIIIENVPREIEDLNSIQNLDLKYTTTEKQVKKPPT